MNKDIKNQIREGIKELGHQRFYNLVNLIINEEIHYSYDAESASKWFRNNVMIKAVLNTDENNNEDIFYESIYSNIIILKLTDNSLGIDENIYNTLRHYFNLDTYELIDILDCELELRDIGITHEINDAFFKNKCYKENNLIIFEN